MSAEAIPDDLMVKLGEMFADNQRRREERAARALETMTPRERQLVREAAVMGYVQGVRSTDGGHRATIPPDSQILADVLIACASFADLYQFIAAAGEGKRPRVRKPRH